MKPTESKPEFFPLGSQEYLKRMKPIILLCLGDKFFVQNSPEDWHEKSATVFESLDCDELADAINVLTSHERKDAFLLFNGNRVANNAYKVTVDVSLVAGMTAEDAEIDPEGLGTRVYEVSAPTESFARERALDEFHDSVAIGVLDYVEIDTEITLAEQRISYEQALDSFREICDRDGEILVAFNRNIHPATFSDVGTDSFGVYYNWDIKVPAPITEETKAPAYTDDEHSMWLESFASYNDQPAPESAVLFCPLPYGRSWRLKSESDGETTIYCLNNTVPNHESETQSREV